MTKQELKAKIDKLENGIKSKATPSNLIAPLKAQKAKFEKELEELETAEKKAVKTKKVSKVAEKIKAAKTSVAKKTPAKAPAKEERKKDNIARDGDRKSLPSGKRISKSGKVYYETRPNRSDKQTSKKPYLAKGGETDPMASVNEISRLTGLRPIAVAEWGDKNNINLSVVLKDLKSKKIKGMDLMTAVVGKPNNKYQKELLAKYSKNKMADGGDTEEGVDLFEDYENIPTDVQKILDKHSDAFEDGDYRKLEKANNELKKIGYTFEYGLDGEAYDLRKIGQKGKMDEDEYANGGMVEIGSEGMYRGGAAKVLKYDDKNKMYAIKYLNEDGETEGNFVFARKDEFEYGFSNFNPKMAKGGELKKAQLLIIDPSNPLSTQLKKLTGDFLNSADFKDIGSGNFNILTHKHSNKVFIVYPKRIYDSLPEQEKQDDINYLKNVEKIKLDTISMAHGGYVIFEGVDHYNGKPLYKVISKDEDNEYDGEFHDNREDAEKELNELKNKDMNYAKGGNTDALKKIKDYYVGAFPTDDLGQEINADATFNGLSMVLNDKGDVYEYLGVADSLVRERVFEKLSKIEGVSYDVIYDKWLDYDYAKGGYMADGGEVNKFTYMMLSRLQSDNEYYLGNGNRYEKALWAGNVDDQISEMKKLWNQLPEDKKPEWLSMEDILEYEKKMKSDKMAYGGYMADGGQVPAHFGSGKNIEVFGYETKNFDICGTAVKEFEAAVDIMKDSKELEKESLAYCAKYVDNLFGIEKVVVEGGIGGELNFSHAVSDIMSASTYNFRAGMAINLYSFVPQHLMEIALRLAKSEKGGFYALGGMTAGRWYKDASGEEFKFIGKIDSGANKGKFLFNDGQKSVYKDLEDFEGGKPKETKLFGFFAEGGEVGKSFTIKEMREKLDRMFPDSFKFNLTNFSKEGNVVLNSTALLQDMNTKYGGLEDKDLNSKLFFPQYKRDHDIKFRVAQGGENTYFYFVLEAEDGEQYIGNFGFKDRGDVSSDYITRFIALLMEQYGLPFEVKHSVMEKGGYMADGGQIKDQYQGKSPEYLWNNWTEKQREHFNHDHELVAANDFRLKSSFDELPEFMKKAISEHYKMGQYAYGGYMADGGELNSIKEEYLKNEDENAHSENVVLLAKHFGTKEDLAKAKEILALHEKEGSLSSENGKKRQELNLKLIGKARAEMGKQGIEFEKGGYMAKGGEVRYKLAGNNFGQQIESGKKFAELIKKAHENQTSEHKYPENFIKEIAYTGKIVKNDGTYFLKDYSYKGVLDRFEFLGDKYFLESLKYLNRPTIKNFKFEDGGYMAKGGKTQEKYEIELFFKGLSGDARKIGKYVVTQKTLEILESEWYDVLSIDVLDESDAKPITYNELREKLYSVASEKGFKYGGMMAKGGEFGFKPYGKTKGNFKITYMADGKKQSETWETKEMAINNAKRYASPKMNGEYTNIKVFDENGKSVEYMAMGGKVKFADKVKAVQESLLKRKNVAPQVQKDYGKTYNKAEAKESAQRIVGSRMAQLKEKMAKKKK